MNYVYIGKIVSVRGLKGEVKVLSDTDFKEIRYEKSRPVFLYKDSTYHPFYVKKFQTVKGLDYVTFKDYEDINLIEPYVGTLMYSEDTVINPEGENEFHIDTLLGLDIFQEGKKVGILENVRNYPQGDYLVVKKLDGKTALIPFQDRFIKEMRLEQKEIEIESIEGLL